LLSPYELIPGEDGVSYRFVTDSNEPYIIYFSEYYLYSRDGEEINITSFGFDSVNDISPFTRDHDPRIKATIIYAIKDFFARHGDDAFNFHSSILIKDTNPQKAKLLEAFYHSHDLWLGSE
jgi:hypothetical protein